MPDEKAYVTSQQQLLLPATEDVMPVPVALWGLVMKRIREASDSSNFIAALGWWCLGAGVSSLIAAITFFLDADSGKGNWGVAEFIFSLLAALGLACGILSLKYAKQHRKDKAQILEYILEDMQLFRDKHKGGRP